MVQEKRVDDHWNVDANKSFLFLGKEIMKNARRHLEVRIDATTPCKKRTKRPVCFQEIEAKHDAPNNFQKQSMLEKWKLMNPRGNVWNHLYLKITKTTSQVRDTTRCRIAIRYTSLCLCRRQKKSRCNSSSVQGMEEARNDSSMEAG